MKIREKFESNSEVMLYSRFESDTEVVIKLEDAINICREALKKQREKCAETFMLDVQLEKFFFKIDKNRSIPKTFRMIAHNIMDASEPELK